MAVTPTARNCVARSSVTPIERIETSKRICLQTRITRETADTIRAAAARLINARVADDERERRSLDATQTRLLQEEVQLTTIFMEGRMSADVHKAKSAEIREQRQNALERLGRPRRTNEVLAARIEEMLGLATSLWDLYQQVSDEKRHELLASVFEVVLLGPEGIMGFKMRPPFNTLVEDAANPAGAHKLATAVVQAA